MPKTPMIYKNTIMYKIVCKDLSIKELYVGHTTNWTKRKYAHKSDCCNENSKSYNFKVYQTIREYGGWDNWDMIEIEKYPCNDRNEARKRERFWYEDFHAQLNTLNPFVTEEESKEHLKEYKKEYSKEYQSRPEVKEHIKEHKKEYHHKNKDKIKKRKTKKETCECGSIVNHSDIARHRKSQKHIKYMESLN
jgi:hypothetical protein